MAEQLLFRCAGCRSDPAHGLKGIRIDDAWSTAHDEARPVDETTRQTIAAPPTLQERLAMVRAFVDAQRVRKDYRPGWFEDVETELHKRMVEIERDLTAEIIAAHDVEANVLGLRFTISATVASLGTSIARLGSSQFLRAQH